MSIITTVFQTLPAGQKQGLSLGPVARGQAKDFLALKHELSALETKGSAGADLHQELMAIQSKVLKGAALTPQELISFQIKANQFGVRVELISKVAESAMATTRKLQNQQ